MAIQIALCIDNTECTKCCYRYHFQWNNSVPIKLGQQLREGSRTYVKKKNILSCADCNYKTGLLGRFVLLLWPFKILSCQKKKMTNDGRLVFLQKNAASFFAPRVQGCVHVFMTLLLLSRIDLYRKPMVILLYYYQPTYYLRRPRSRGNLRFESCFTKKYQIHIPPASVNGVCRQYFSFISTIIISLF